MIGYLFSAIGFPTGGGGRYTGTEIGTGQLNTKNKE
jgi:hypothetical protein